MSKGDRAEGVLDSLATEKRELERQLQDQRTESAKTVATLSERLATLEDEWSNLANFYVAVQQLYSATGRDDTLGAIVDVVTNLVGSEEVAIFEMGDDGLMLTRACGTPAEPLRRIPSNTGLIGWVAQSGKMFLPESRSLPSMPSPAPYEHSLTACVPMLVRGRVTGAVAIFRMLPQKPGISALDRFLFEVLQRHAGVALCVSAPVANGHRGPSS